MGDLMSSQPAFASATAPSPAVGGTGKEEGGRVAPALGAATWYVTGPEFEPLPLFETRTVVVPLRRSLVSAFDRFNRSSSFSRNAKSIIPRPENDAAARAGLAPCERH